MAKNIFIYLLPIIIILSFTFCTPKEESINQPNIVIIFLDDAGFAYFQPFAETRYPTSNVSRLAEEGRSFYSFLFARRSVQHPEPRYWQAFKSV